MHMRYNAAAVPRHVTYVQFIHTYEYIINVLHSLLYPTMTSSQLQGPNFYIILAYV